MVGAGFIAFTILNAILVSRRLAHDRRGRAAHPAAHGGCRVRGRSWRRGSRSTASTIRTGATLTGIEESRGKRKLSFAQGGSDHRGRGHHGDGHPDESRVARRRGSRAEHRAGRGIVVDDHLRSSARNVYAAGDVAARRESRDRACPRCTRSSRRRRSTGGWWAPTWPAATSPIAGSLVMNIVEVCHLDVASFGQWDDPSAEVYTAVRPERSLYRKLLFHGGRLAGAVICGPGERHLDDQ